VMPKYTQADLGKASSLAIVEDWGPSQRDIAQLLADERAATIERCAEEVERKFQAWVKSEETSLPLADVLASIRALGDE